MLQVTTICTPRQPDVLLLPPPAPPVLVPASDLHGNFVRQFWRFQAKSKDIKGVRYIGLSKVAGG